MAEEYAQKLAGVVVGQIADTCGYQQAHKHALNAVSDVMMRFVQELGMYAKEGAEAQGRTDVNALDVVCSGHCSLAHVNVS
jgi:transcription initiation factor TFIID subunit 8